MTIGSLFSGIGGLELGLEMCGAGPVVWQAESDPYARAVLEKHWPTVKRYDDVRSIDGTAERPDIICGGFPCQDISNAGKRAGIDGERSGLWSEYARIVRVLRPAVVFVENVAALAARGLDRVLGDLAEMGFNAEWGVFRADEAGAPHRRERLFILAYADGDKRNERWQQFAAEGAARGAVADPARIAQREPADEAHPIAARRQTRNEPSHASDLANAHHQLGNVRQEQREGNAHAANLNDHRWPPGPSEIHTWTGAQPALRRGDDGLSRRVDRLRCLGNSVVPQQAALAFRALLERATA